MAHNFIRDGWATGLQPVVATAGYILPTSKLETEKPNLVPCDKGARPFDLSFDIDPHPSATAPVHCPFSTIGGDITITPPVPLSDFSTSDDVIESVAAAAETHLQTRERKKFMRDGKKDTITGELIPGQRVMGDLVRSDVVLIPMAIDPHGHWGPMTQNLLCHYTPREDLHFPTSHPHAAAMYARAITPPCPSGLIPTAAINWKHNKTRRFFGHSYTAPTPNEHTIQQLGLVITKAFGLHLRNASRKMGYCPPTQSAANATGAPSSTELDIELTDSDDDESTVTFN